MHVALLLRKLEDFKNGSARIGNSYGKDSDMATSRRLPIELAKLTVKYFELFLFLNNIRESNFLKIFFSVKNLLPSAR